MSDNKFSIWVDLEETVIQSWHNPLILYNNIQKIKRYCAFHGYQSNRINIFSHAVWNDEDFNDFYNFIAPDLERAFGTPFVINKCMKVDWLMKHAFGNWRIHTQGEYVATYNKFESFMRYIPLIGAIETNFILFDDLVPTCTIELLESENSVRFVNINSI
jgi:hypothetical protein